MAEHATITVPATHAGASRAAAAFDEFCRVREVPAEGRWRLQIALDEILSNTMHYGFRDRSGVVALTFSHDAQSVTVEIVDDAPAFDPRRAPVPDTTLPLEARRPGGLGLVLVESLVDDVAYERRGDENRLTLTWRPRADRSEAEASETRR